MKWQSVFYGLFEASMFLIALACFCLLATSCSTGVPLAIDEAQPTAAIVTPAASVFEATESATPAATATIAPELIEVYAAPNGAKFPDPINLAGEAVLVVARGGMDWAQLKRPDTSLVWVMRADLPINMNVPDSLPDLLYVPPTAAPARQPNWQPAATATSAPAATSGAVTVRTSTPAQPTATIVWPTSQAKRSDFAAPDTNASCAFTGCLHQTPTNAPAGSKPIEKQKP